MPATIQQNYPKNNKTKIILTENVYNKMNELLEMSKKSCGIENYEYGTILFGHKDGENVVFNEFSKEEDYIPKVGAFNPETGKKMFEEMLTKIVTDNNCNCVAHVHTHPYILKEGWTSREMSDVDINYYSNFFAFGNKTKESIKKFVLGFGCVLTYDENKKNDDISFVHYNTEKDEMEYLPEIMIRVEDKDIPLKKETFIELISDNVSISTENIERIMLDCPKIKELSNSDPSI